MTSDPKCYYHQERDAVSHCEKCGRLMCVECKRIYRRRRTTGSGEYSHTYTERYEYCPICKYTMDEKYSSSQYIGLVCFFPIWIITLFIMPWAGSFFILFDLVKGLFLLIGFFGLGYGIYGVVVKGPQLKQEAIDKRNQFMQEVGLSNVYNREQPREISRPKDEKPYFDSVIQEKNTFYYAQCGSLLNKRMKFCPSCGDTTADELDSLKRQ